MTKHDVTGNVTWSANTGCGTTTVTSGNPGIATCVTSTLPVGTDAVTGTYNGDANHSGSMGSTTQQVNAGSTSIDVTSVSPSSEGYGQDATVTITAVLSWTGAGPAPTAANVTIGGNGPSGYGVTSCGSPSGDTMTCTNTYTPSVADGPGSYTETASFSGDSNYGASTQSGNQQLQHRSGVDDHGRNHQRFAVGLRLIGDVHCDHQRPVRPGEGTQWTRETARRNRFRNLGRAHGLRHNDCNFRQPRHRDLHHVDPGSRKPHRSRNLLG